MNVTVEVSNKNEAIAAIEALRRLYDLKEPTATEAAKPKVKKADDHKAETATVVETPKEPEPVKKDDDTPVTIETVRESLKALSSVHGREFSIKVLKGFAPTLDALDEKDYRELADKCARLKDLPKEEGSE